MPRLFDLSIHHVHRWIFNCYVVPDGGEGRPLVIDAGLPCIGDAARAVLDQLGADTPSVAATHGHADHVGGIVTLLEGRRGTVHLPARCAAYLAGEPARTPGPREVVKILPVLADQRFDGPALLELARGGAVGYGQTTAMRVPFEVDGFLADGQPTPGASEWEVLSTPGHTDDSTCFYHRPTETLISGDAILTHQGKAWFNPEVVDPHASRETEERLRAWRVSHLLPGHGQPIAGEDLLHDARSFAHAAPGGSPLARLARLLGRW